MKQPPIEAPRLRESDDMPPDVFQMRGDYLGLRIKAKNYSGQSAARLEIVGCHFHGTNLAATCWESAHISDTIFENCDFAGARWEEADLHRVEFVGCRLTGFCAPNARFSHAIFRDCQMGLAQLHNLKTKSCKLENCVLHESDWSESDLRGAIFYQCDFKEADFYRAKLQKADLRGSDIESLRLGDDPMQNIELLRGVMVEPMQAALLGAQFGLKVCWNEENS